MIKGGPRVVTDGLVLCLDAHDAKSYAGEPTTNNLDSSDRANANTGPNVSYNFASIAITKEVVNYSSDRPHVYRFKSTNATGYVSIGYNSSIQNQSGSVYAFSFDYKVVRADSGTTTNLHTAGMTVYGNGYKNPTSSTIASNVTSSEVELSDGWKRVTKTYTCGYTGYNQTRQNLMTQDTGDFEVLIDNIQFEDKTYSTPFANLSRSATNGWVDRSGNSNSGTLTNMIGTEVTHYRDGQVIMPVANSYLDFDGSNDYVTIGTNPTGIDQVQVPLTICAWVWADSFGSYNPIWAADKSTSGGGLYSMLRVDGGTLKYFTTDSTGGIQSRSGPSLSTNTWYFLAATVSGTTSSATVNFYLNGSLSSSSALSVMYSSPMANVEFRIGANERTSGERWDGKIPIVYWYNKALTAAEVLSNYNATKGRFS